MVEGLHELQDGGHYRLWHRETPGVVDCGPSFCLRRDAWLQSNEFSEQKSGDFWDSSVLLEGVKVSANE
jgi:hypothetical protein